MTTSGTYSFSYGRDQIIRAAYRKIGAIEAGEIPSAEMTLDGADALNMMVKEWEATGIHVWTEVEGFLFVQPGQIQYSISTGSSDSSTTATPIVTSVSSITGTALVVASGVGIASTNYIGIQLASGGLFWTTVSLVSGNSITLAAGPPTTVTSGAIVYSYPPNTGTSSTSNHIGIGIKPLRIPQGRRVYYPSNTFTQMRPMSRQDYFDQPNKNSPGTITQFYYSPRQTAGQVYLWPSPPDVFSVFEFTWLRPIQDFDVAGDTPDLPQEWISTLVYNLAIEMAPEYGVPQDVYAMVKSAAAEKLDRLMGWDREDQSVQFGVDFSQMG